MSVFFFWSRNKDRNGYNGQAQASFALSWNDQSKICTYFIGGGSDEDG